MKLAIISLIVVLGAQEIMFHGSCTTDNGKKISNCEIKRE